MSYGNQELGGKKSSKVPCHEQEQGPTRKTTDNTGPRTTWQDVDRAIVDGRSDDNGWPFTVEDDCLVSRMQPKLVPPRRDQEQNKLDRREAVDAYASACAHSSLLRMQQLPLCLPPVLQEKTSVVPPPVKPRLLRVSGLLSQTDRRTDRHHNRIEYCLLRLYRRAEAMKNTRWRLCVQTYRYVA